MTFKLLRIQALFHNNRENLYLLMILNRFTRGDRKAIEEFEKTNKKLTNQILIRVFWVLFALAVSSSVKLVVSYVVQHSSARGLPSTYGVTGGEWRAAVKSVA